MTAKNLTVTTALPPRGREEAVLRVAAKYEPSLLRIVARIPMPDLRRPLDLHRFLLHRERTLKRLDAAAALARTMVGPHTKVETDLVRTSVDQPPVGRTPTHDGPVAVAVAEREAVMSS